MPKTPTLTTESEDQTVSDVLGIPLSSVGFMRFMRGIYIKQEMETEAQPNGDDSRPRVT